MIIEPDLVIRALEAAPMNRTFTVIGVLCPDNLSSAISTLWEIGIDTPTIVVNPRRIRDMIGWGDEPPPLLRFQAIAPADWKSNGSLRGRFLDCEVHASPALEWGHVVAFHRIQDPIGTILAARVYIC